jgi:DmsE family decaheme c-type cytochrome
MRRIRPPSTHRSALSLAIVVALVPWTGAARAADPPPAPVCADCHAEQWEGLGHVPHGNAADPRTPLGRGLTCEACHGDATAHAEDPIAAMPAIRYGPGYDARIQNETCLGCHRGGHLMHWTGSTHERSQVTCAACHNPHAVEEQVLIRETQGGVCFDCHKQVRADLFRSSSHPLRSGWMSCSSCHNPHGSVADGLLVEHTVNETCYQCHADKRGPFLWEHPPAREDCLNCHRPHGSNNAPLLEARGPYLCQQCHLNPRHPSTLYSGNNLPPNAGADKMLGANCLNCHSKVHGSNHPSGARFTR